jgi:hypothetical protein
VALLKLDPQEALAGMRAVKSVITVEGPVLEVQRTARALAQRYVLGTAHDVDALAPIEPEALARAIVDPARRRQVVQVMCGYVMLGRQVRPAYLAAIRAYARALEIDDPALDQLRYLMEDRLRWLKFDFRRRGLVGQAIQRAYAEDGLSGAIGTILEIAGHHEDRALAARFDALAELPGGTLGRALWEFYREHGFTLPGRPKGTPMPLISHDASHVLAGHGTDVLGEVRTLAFQSGYRRESPMMLLFLMLYVVQLGVDMVALAPGVGSLRGFLDDPAALEEVFKAYARGAAMTVDLMDPGWDMWAAFERPLTELRASYGID